MSQRWIRTGFVWVGVFVMATVLAGLLALGWMLVVYPNVPATSEAEPLTLTPTSEQTASALARRLHEAGIIDNVRLWEAYLKLAGVENRLRDHRVVYKPRMTPREVAMRSARGLGRFETWLTIPEGYTRFDIAKRLELYGVCGAAGFLAATQDRDVLAKNDIKALTAEGYLFPDTYELIIAMPPEDVVTKMVQNWHRRFNALTANDEQAFERFAQQGWDVYQLLTLASIVEKEAAVAAERPVIAGVFLNRLRSSSFLPRHRLQADPTVQYGCIAEPARASSCSTFAGRITKAMLEDSENRYNTYQHAGLPPGPICNPGAASLDAVLRYQKHRYLYFVSRGDGSHVFSATLDEHNRAVNRFIRGAPR